MFTRRDQGPGFGKRNSSWGKDSRVPVPGSKNSMQSEYGKEVRGTPVIWDKWRKRR